MAVARIAAAVLAGIWLGLSNISAQAHHCPDFNGDNIVGITDLLAVIQKYGTPQTGPQVGWVWDVDHSGRVMISDILYVYDRLGQVC